MTTTERPRLEDVPELVYQMQKDLEWLKKHLLSKEEQIEKELADNTILSVSDAAKLTKYSEQTIRMKVMVGEIPSYKLGGKRVFNKTELLDWINENRRN